MISPKCPYLGGSTVLLRVQTSFHTHSSYTTFMYSDLFLSPSDVNAGRNLTVKVTVQNTGGVDGYEVSVIHIIKD